MLQNKQHHQQLHVELSTGINRSPFILYTDTVPGIMLHLHTYWFNIGLSSSVTVQRPAIVSNLLAAMHNSGCMPRYSSLRLKVK